MKRYREIRRITSHALRQLCTEQKWYTKGTNEEYKHLLLDLAKYKDNLSTADIIEIAEDIFQHSELNYDDTVEFIAYLVTKETYSIFEEI